MVGGGTQARKGQIIYAYVSSRKKSSHPIGTAQYTATPSHYSISNDSYLFCLFFQRIAIGGRRTAVTEGNCTTVLLTFGPNVQFKLLATAFQVLFLLQASGKVSALPNLFTSYLRLPPAVAKPTSNGYVPFASTKVSVSQIPTYYGALVTMSKFEGFQWRHRELGSIKPWDLIMLAKRHFRLIYAEFSQNGNTDKTDEGFYAQRPASPNGVDPQYGSSWQRLWQKSLVDAVRKLMMDMADVARASK
ncbi:hypothetical protein BC835DRAFT_1303831 [Cytidiella melzeri]|nr:hypothetical protein BC835DRAFT_1303831 [Cytidiella melzeri]